MKKIKVEHYYGIHYHALCKGCNFAPGIQTDETQSRSDVRNAVRKHVLKTGHKVSIESAKVTYYSLDPQSCK